MTGIPPEQLAAMIRLLWPEEITPIAKRQLESLVERYLETDAEPESVVAVDR